MLGAGGYHLNVKYAGIGYARCTLVTSRLAWRWEGVVYEFLACDAPLELETLVGPSSSWRMMGPAAASRHLSERRRPAGGGAAQTSNETRETCYSRRVTAMPGSSRRAADTYCGARR